MAVALAIAFLPSAVLGPVLMPPWFLHLPLASALAWQGWPVLLACAPHICLYLIRLHPVKFNNLDRLLFGR